MHNPMGTYKELDLASQKIGYFSLNELEKSGLGPVSKLPFSLKILLESLLRNLDGYMITEEDIRALCSWDPKSVPDREIAFKPARVILQDFTGVPSVVDLAALRSAMSRLGNDPSKINPLIPVDLVIDHSLQVDNYGTESAIKLNLDNEFKRNFERYQFLKWGQSALKNFRVVPPSTGIIHQVNLEYLSKLVQTREIDGKTIAIPDSLVGTDSHTTMINGLGVVGWGVGGIEAEAVMLGQPIYMLIPQVVGFRLDGELPEGTTATDMVLTVTQILRKHNVVGKFVEFYGSGLQNLALPDRAILANMAPEYGATMGFCPVDDKTLDFMRETGRDKQHVDLVEHYCKEQGLFLDSSSDPIYSSHLKLDLNTIEPSLAGPKRPQDRIPLSKMKPEFHKALKAPASQRGFDLGEKALRDPVKIKDSNMQSELNHGSVIIASITSCTNTSNPSVMIAAGLLAKKAVKKGLSVKPHVKTSLIPGSRVVKSYLEDSGLLSYLNELKFNIVGFGCATCIGNSGPIQKSIADAVQENNLVAAAVLSGNRNFEGRISPHVKANYLASPPLVVAYALAGTVDIDLDKKPLGNDKEGNKVYLKDIWPSRNEIQTAMNKSLKPEMFISEYSDVFSGSDEWNNVPVPQGELYSWDENSTYVREPSFFKDLSSSVPDIKEIKNARVLIKVGDSVTTDHISPAGAIAKDSPAAEYLIKHGVDPKDFNSYGSRRGNHEVMMRGTFANIRIKNQLLQGIEGGMTKHFPAGEVTSIYEASMKYQKEQTALIVIAGKDYGMGSSRDWAAKGTYLLGVKAVIAKSYERIHRSNLIGMGVLPLQFMDTENPDSIGLTGEEIYSIDGPDNSLKPGQILSIKAEKPDGNSIIFKAVTRIDTPVEVEYYRNGGILQTVLRKMI